MSFEAADEQRRRLEIIAINGNSKVKHRRRVRIIQLSDNDLGTVAIMAETGSAKATDPALAVVHGKGRGGSSSRQEAQVGEPADVREEGSRTFDVGAEFCGGRGDVLGGSR